MKKKSSLQLILMFIFTVATIISCKNDSASTTEENPFGDVTSIAEITSTPAKNVGSLFVFTTAGGRMFIMANAEAANKINEEFQNEGFHLGGLGVGTAFIINERGETLLCTATHCAEGLEKFSKNYGADISIVDVNNISGLHTEKKLTGGYKISSLNQNDSIFVKGYVPDEKDGSLSYVEIKGLGIIKDKSSLKDVTFAKNPLDSNLRNKTVDIDKVQEKTMNLKMVKNVNLGGLSGAPVFNKNGEVVGVFAGRTLIVSGKDTSCYARISLF